MPGFADPGRTKPCTPILTDSPALSDLSERDKPWDKHRSNADIVGGYYKGSEFEQYASRMDFCSGLLDFHLVPDVDEGSLRLKLYGARFCRVRHCPVCQWRRSLMWKAKAYQALPKVVEEFPKHRWLFLTLTVKNCPIAELRDTLDWMNTSFKRMTKRKEWSSIDGWLKSTEVTRGRDGSAHPHFHCLLMVKPSYFSTGYISQKRWGELWQSCLRSDYEPILDVRAVRKGSKPMALIPELLKYCTKESDLTADREWFLELTRQMHKSRCIAVGGTLRQHFKALEQEPEDLIGQDSEDGTEPNEGTLRFGWRYREKRYRLVQDAGS